MPVFEDSEGAVQLAQNPVTNSNSMHIDVRHHFLRELVSNETISITHVRSVLDETVERGDVPHPFQFCL